MSTLYSIKTETLARIGAAIREKNGTEVLYTPSEMAAAINKIESGGVKLNLAYGSTAPENTDMLWVKTAEPSAVKIQPTVQSASEKIEIGIGILPKPTSNMAIATVGSNVFLFGGSTKTGKLNTINVFNPKTNTLTQLDTVLAIAANSVTAAAVGEKVYLFGGYTGNYLNTIQVFDSKSNAISTLSTTLPKGASRIAAAAVGNSIYLFGGQCVGDLDTIQMFNTETNTLTQLSATLPAAENSICAAAVGTKIYLLGGNTKSGAIYAFDTATNTISTMSATIPADAGCFYNAAGAIGTKIYLFGGRRNDDVRTDAIAVYDTENDTISVLDVTLPQIVESMGAAVVGTDVYLFGGGYSTTYFDTIHKFVTTFDLPHNHGLIEMSLDKNLFNLISGTETTVQLGVANVYFGNADGAAERVPAAICKDGVWVEI